jgi:hypothetical protein
MHIPTLLLGIAAVLYGLYTAWARMAKPEQFHKLEAMKKAYGEGAGTTVHLISYTVVPIVVGLGMILLGVNGRSIF